jgi:hypothetical protein
VKIKLIGAVLGHLVGVALFTLLWFSASEDPVGRRDAVILLLICGNFANSLTLRLRQIRER